MQNTKSNQAIAVVGMGCRYPGARDLRHLWENILARRQQFRRFPDVRLPISEYHDPDPATPDKTYGTRAAFIDGFEFDWSNRRIPRAAVESTDVAHWLSLEVALKAIEDAGYTREKVPYERTGVIVGNTLTGEQTRSSSMRTRWPFVQRALRAAAEAKAMPAHLVEELVLTMEEYYKSVFAPVTEDTLAGGLSNTIAGRVCNFFNFQGGGYTVDGACSSSLIAIATAANALASGELDMALAGGVDISLDTFELIGFAKTNALTKSDMKVYDRKASGFIPGEGCGFVALKRLEEARADGNYVYAVLRGWGISSDGRGGITAPNREGQATALRRAYARAGYSPQTLDFIEGHGTGTPVGDRTELEGIALALNTDGEAAPRSCGVTSFKSIVGHTKAAAGVGGFIKAVMAVNRRVLPPTAGCKDYNAVLETSARSVYPILQGEVRKPDTVLRAGVSAMGFGGINCHVTIESGDVPNRHVAPSLDERALLVTNQETELFILNAGAISALIERAQSVRQVAVGMSIAELVDLAAQMARESDQRQPLRAAVIARSPEELVKRLELLEKMLKEHPPAAGEFRICPQQEVWIGHGVRSARIGFLFPGQGSQQLNMARVLVERYEWARELLAQADIWLREIGAEPIGDFIYRALERAHDQHQVEEWSKLLARTEIAQPAICLASILWLRFMEQLGIKPAAIGGHSLGELTAFYAAGAFTEKTLLCLAAVRGQAMAASGEDAGTMASLGCSREVALEFLQQAGGAVSLANINSPKQVVISGDRAGVEAVVRLAAGAGVQTRMLSVSNAFHSPFVAGAAKHLRQHAPVPKTLKKINTVLFSGINGKQVKPALRMREHFADQVLAQVDFVSLVESLAQSSDVLVEVGPGRVLSTLANDITGAGGPMCLPLASQPKQDRDLNAVLSCLFVNGLEINWDTLYENRLVRPFISASEMVFIENPCERPFKVSAAGATQTAAHGGDWLATSLAETLDVAGPTLSNYLAKRGKFLAEVVRADLQTLPALMVAPDELAQFRAATANVRQQTVDAAPHLAVTRSDALAGNASTDAEVPERTSISNLLLELVEQRTGFPLDTLTLDLRLLDDLNLDSIKAAELVAEAAKSMGIEKRLDPSQFATASLSEVAEAIQQLAEDGAVEQPEQRQHRTTPHSQAGTTKASSSSEEPEAQSSWVRNFVVPYVAESLSPEIIGATVVDWSGANILILSEPGEDDLVEKIASDLTARKARVETSFYTGAEARLSGGGAAFTHCIALMPRKSDTGLSPSERLRSAVERLRTAALMSPASSARPDGMTIAYVQFTGGDGATAARPADIDRGGAAAFTASLHLERPDLKIRAIDFSTCVEPGSLSRCVLDELSAPEIYATASYDRKLIRRVPRPHVQEPVEYQDRSISWTTDDVMMVTGGGKGITAECALAFARSSKVKMALVGSSPYRAGDNLRQGSDEIAQTLARFSAEQLTCRYYQCDITDAAAVDELVRRVRAELGPITGVIHGAAINHPRRVEQVSAEAACREVAPKVLGALNLCRALDASPPKLFAGFSSIIGVTGMSGNAWYGFANESLDLLLGRFEAEHPETSTLSIAFSVWGEVGMGARMGSTRHLAKMGIGAIPTGAGVERFLQLMHGHPGARQVVVAARLGGLDTWKPTPHAKPAASRFLENIISLQPDVEVVSRVRLTLLKDAYLLDHDYKGSYLFPTVFGLEAMAQAVAYVTGESGFQCVRIEDIRLERPIVVDPQKGVEIEIHAEVQELASAEGLRLVHVGIRTEQTGFTRDHFAATFVLGLSNAAPKIQLERSAQALGIEPGRDLYSWLLFQGPLFQRLHQIYSLDSSRCVFSSEQRSYLPGNQDGEASMTAGPFILGDPFFRDSLLQAPQLVLSKDICLPVRINSIELYQPQRAKGSVLTGVAINDGSNEREANATVYTLDESGNVLEKLNGYYLRVLEHREDHPTPEEIALTGQHRTEQLDGAQDDQQLLSTLVSTRAADTQPDLLNGLAAVDVGQQYASELGYNVQAYRISADRNGPEGQPVLTLRFPLTFRDTSNLSRSLYFSHYFMWMGKVRELAMQPVYERLAEQFSTGKWGMVTNHAETRILGSAKASDVLEARVWLDNLYGPLRSTTDLFYEWSKMLPDGTRELVALSKMCTTWVAIREHGVVEAQPFPDYVLNYMESVLPEGGDPKVSHRSLAHSKEFDLGEELYAGPSGPINKLLLREQVFETSLEDANLVGNIYFANYYCWQGRIRDHFLYELFPERFRGTGESGELRCLYSKVEHLREAMPFERIMVKMSLGRVNEKGVQFLFEYYRLTPDGRQEKLAFGEQRAAWFSPTADGEWFPTAIPAALRAGLLLETEVMQVA